MRAEAEKEINKIVENTTFEHESNNYAASEESLNKIERFASIYHRLNAVPDGFAWPTFEGTPVTMTLAQFLSLAATAGTHAMTVLNKKIVDIGKVKVATNSQEIKDI